jgi:hypothetical protein
MAPELHNPEIFDLKQLRRTVASDVYALACVALEVHDGFTHLYFLNTDGITSALRFTLEIIHLRTYFVTVPSS